MRIPSRIRAMLTALVWRLYLALHDVLGLLVHLLPAQVQNISNLDTAIDN